MEARIDKLVTELSETSDRETRKRAFNEIQAIVAEETPVVSIVSRHVVSAANSRVGNLFRAASSPTRCGMRSVCSLRVNTGRNATVRERAYWRGSGEFASVGTLVNTRVSARSPSAYSIPNTLVSAVGQSVCEHLIVKSTPS